jgi:small-conductance mechanosensitive channel
MAAHQRTMSDAANLTARAGGLYLALAETFRANGISLLFPQREVRLLGPGGRLA